eukprot:TRINITY_DN5521_c0_g1_i1.p1 TRINITY_DN5521_c0_g1~~TRINITY_DN5521_c0_g1_i1.p1  ORF type:complete len:468 (+),score=87.41 TRINITY_DN5521_c0_g1_i1:187-1590(+)
MEMKNSVRKVLRVLIESNTQLVSPKDVSADLMSDNNSSEEEIPRVSSLDQSIVGLDWTMLKTSGETFPTIEEQPLVFHRWGKGKEKDDLKKFQKLLSRKSINLDDLKELSKQGVPPEVRAIVWKILLGYIPLKREFRDQSVTAKRERYAHFLSVHWQKGVLPEFQNVLRDIDADVPRTFPRGLIELFEKESMREMLRRLLFIYAVTHPKRGYWQGLNDLLVPFIVVFLAFSLGSPILQLNQLSNEELQTALGAHHIEADVYWCLCYFLRSFQHNYVIRTPEIDINTSFDKIKTLLSISNPALLNHMDRIGLDFVFFGCRWLICMLIREFSLDNVARLWDTYLAHGSSLFVFHQYFCVSYLQSFSTQILQCDEISSALSLLNNPPNDDWSNAKIDALIRNVDDLVRKEKTANVCLSFLTVLITVSAAVLALVVAGVYISFVSRWKETLLLFEEQKKQLESKKKQSEKK